MSATKIMGPSHLLLVGIGLFSVGAACAIAYHALPLRLARELDSLLGVEAYRAHLVTLFGMLAIGFGLFWKGVGGFYDNRCR